MGFIDGRIVHDTDGINVVDKISSLTNSIGSKVSTLTSYSYSAFGEWLNELESRMFDSAINVMGKKYRASGSLNVHYGNISNSSTTLTITTANHDFKVGHGIAIRTSDGAKEVETLKITAGATTAGNLSLKLDGVVLTIAVAAGDTAIQVADKIRTVAKSGNGGVISQSLSGTGWNVDSNATGSTDTLTFDHSNQGTKNAMTLTAGSTGVTATVTVTTAGVNTAKHTTKVTAVNGDVITLRDAYTTSSLTSKRVEHDDTEAIQAAIDDASATDGGIVFLPAYSFPITQIKMKSRVMLKGTGYRSRLYQKGNSNLDVIILSNSSQEMVMLYDFSIDGQKNSQSSGRGIKFDNTGGSNFSFYDPIHAIKNVLVMNTKGDGFSMSGTREARVDNVFVFQADGHGFQLTPTDCFFTSCTSAGAGLHGFTLNAPNTRLTTCKAYGSGRLDANSNGDGFLISGSRHLVNNCEAQDNGRHGFYVYGGRNNRLENCLADSNGNRTTGNPCGFNVGGAASFNKIEGTALNRTSYEFQKYGLSIGTDCLNNTVNLQAPDTDAVNLLGEIYAGQGAGSTITINNQRGVQTVTYASTITPLIYNGGTIITTLTGNLTVANTANGRYHTGAEMTLILKQDATGGRTVSFGTQYKTNWTPDTTANKTNIIKFVFDGTNWMQTSATVAV